MKFSEFYKTSVKEMTSDGFKGGDIELPDGYTEISFENEKAEQLILDKFDDHLKWVVDGTDHRMFIDDSKKSRMEGDLMDAGFEEGDDWEYPYDYSQGLPEGKNVTVIDSMSGSDSSKIADFLDSQKIKYEKVGSEFTIQMDRNSLEASTVLSKLHSIAMFDDLSEINEAKDKWKYALWSRPPQDNDDGDLGDSIFVQLPNLTKTSDAEKLSREQMELADMELPGWKYSKLMDEPKRYHDVIKYQKPTSEAKIQEASEDPWDARDEVAKKIKDLGTWFENNIYLGSSAFGVSVRKQDQVADMINMFEKNVDEFEKKMKEFAKRIDKHTH